MSSLRYLLPTVTCVFALALLAPAAASAAGYWGDLSPGPYEVGFRVENRYDHSRQAAPWGGPERAAETAQLIQISVWYPAAATDVPPMRYEEFLHLTPQRASLAGDGMLYMGNLSARLGPVTDERRRLAREGLRHLMGLIGPEPDEAGVERILATETASKRGAPPHPGRFPVLVYGAAATAGNVPLCEYLASHGYVVLSTPGLGKDSWMENAAGHALAFESQIDDVEFLASWLPELEGADPSRLGLIAFDFSSLSFLEFQLKSLRADALVSLEGWEGHGFGTSGVKDSPHFEVARMRVPFLYLAMSRERSYDWSVIDALRYSERYVLAFENLRRGDFLAHHVVAGTASPDQRLGYELMSRYVRHFFDAFVKGEAPKRAFLDAAPEAHGVRAGFVEVRHAPALPPVPSQREIWDLLLAEGGIAELERIYERFARDEPGEPLFGEDMINLAGYRLLQDGRTADAVAAMELMVEAYPDSANAYDSLGEAYMAHGERERAVASYRRSLELDPSNQNAEAQLAKLDAAAAGSS